jgi:hypothetical protein
VQDHAIRVAERIDGFRTTLDKALAVHSALVARRQTEVNLQQNEQVKKISSWAAIIFAFSIVPPFSRYTVIPVARHVWFVVPSGSPAARTRRFIISHAVNRVMPRSEHASRVCIARKSGPSVIPAAARYASTYSSAR